VHHTLLAVSILAAHNLCTQ